MAPPHVPQCSNPFDTSNFDKMVDPDAGVAVSLAALPEGIFDEFTELAQSQLMSG